MRATYGSQVAFTLMNSFSTSADTRRFLEQRHGDLLKEVRDFVLLWLCLQASVLAVPVCCSSMGYGRALCCSGCVCMLA